MLDPGYLTELSGSLQILKEFVALHVHIGRYMMGNLARGVAEAYPGIVRGGPDPQGPRRLIDFR
jgi:hypothetical protein